MIAELPMYDMGPLQAANDALWAAVRDRLRARGIAAPEALDRQTPMWEVWTDPALVLGQTCGLPFRTKLHGRVSLIATPDYGLPGTAPGYYRSIFVAEASDPRSATEDFAAAAFAYNQPESHSGWAAPQIWAAARGFAFRPSLQTGGHRASALAVAEGRAEIAALDAVTFRFLGIYEPELISRLKIVGETQEAPGLPFIAALSADAAATFAALAEAIAALPAETRDRLMLKGLLRIPAADYLAVPTPPAP